MAFKAPFFRYEDLRRCAESFLTEYHVGREIPVPIEKIIEFELGMDIVPMPGLGNFDTVAYLSHDLNEIRVDEFIYNHRPNRYRFSLAHELGHRVLHADVFQQFKFTDVETWKHVMAEVIPLDQYRYLEWHANSFAGLILVPAHELRQAFFDDVEKGQGNGVDFDEPATGARELVEAHLADIFEVSAEVIHKRIEFDKLWHSG
jgi:Zn-dependent peptidase ImmA (M78 family)